MSAVEKHAANLARVEALRDRKHPYSGYTWQQIQPEVPDHIEDVLTRHEPYMDCFDANDPVGVQLHCSHCMEPYDQDTNRCPDYASALRLLDALDRG